MIKPWERQKNEAPRAYEAFVVYRDMGRSRTVRAVSAVMFPKSQNGGSEASLSRTVADWSKRNKWVERAKDWDREVDRMALKEQTNEIVRMNRRHADEARLLQEKALERLRTLDPNQLSAADTLRFFVEATKIERTALGVPEKIEKLIFETATEEVEPETPPEYLAEVLKVLQDSDAFKMYGNQLESNKKEKTEVIDVEFAEANSTIKDSPPSDEKILKATDVE